MNRNESIINIYNSGQSSLEIAKITGLHRTTITRILKKNKIDIRSLSKSHQKYKINETFFDEIDTEEKAYILGFIYADGNLTRNSIEISLQENDKEILEKISNYIYSTHKPLGYRKPSIKKFKNKFYKCKAQYRFSIVNKHIKNTITLLGIMPNKTFKIRFPFQINPSCYKHFIRGYYDGDGCLSTNSNTKDNIIKIISNHKFCKELLSIITSNLPIKAYVKKKNGSKVFELVITGNKQIKKFLDWLYTDSNLYLKRKNNLYKKLYST